VIVISILSYSMLVVISFASLSMFMIAQDVKKGCCESLLKDSVDTKMKAKKVATVVNRLEVAQPKPRDSIRRDPVVPQSVLLRKQTVSKTPDDSEGGRVGRQAMRGRKIGGNVPYNDPHKFGEVFDYHGKDLTQQYMLKNNDWKDDIVPEIMDGKNIADFFEPDIEKRLEALEREETQQLKEWYANQDAQQIDQVDEADRELVKKIRSQRGIVVSKHRMNKGGHRFGATIPRKFRRRTGADLKNHLKALGVIGVDPETQNTTIKSKKRSRSLSRRRDEEVAAELAARGEGEDIADQKRARGRSKMGNRSRSISRVAPRDVSGMPKNKALRKKTEKLRKKQQLVGLGRKAAKGEGDRTHLNMKPKWLLSGKTGLGTRDWR
jgi:nucleolar GTP-binding protein